MKKTYNKSLWNELKNIKLKFQDKIQLVVNTQRICLAVFQKMNKDKRKKTRFKKLTNPNK